MAWHKRLLNLVRSRHLSGDIDRELAFHMAERADELIAAGMSEADAAREARRRFGNYGLQKERTREADVFNWLESLVADLRYAMRSLRASPGFALVAILSLALGIGANTAIFSLIDAVMLKYLPVSHPEQLVQVMLSDENGVFTNPLWEQLRDRQDVFTGVFAVGDARFDLSTGGEARHVAGDLVSGDFFFTLGVGPALGRTITQSDDWRGCPAIAVLSYGFWQGDYGGDATVIGKTISLDSHPFQIVGVAAPGFFGVDVGQSVQVYAPLCAEAVLRGTGSFLDRRSTWFLRVIARPKPGLAMSQVSARLKAIAPGIYEATVPPNWRPKDQKQYLQGTLGVRPVANGFSDVRHQYRGALIALMAVVGIVLLIACANVANLLLARATVRQREIAIRLAIGAGRRRLIRQLLTESVLLSLCGAVLGMLFAKWGSRLLVGFLDTNAGHVSLDLSIDARVLGFTIVVAMATGLLFGLAPAWRSTRVSPQAAMKSGGRGVAEGHSRFTLGKALVIAQVALSLVLLMGAGLMLGTFRSLARLDPGFQRDAVLIASTDLRSLKYSAERQRQFYHDMTQQLRTLPGVRAASASVVTPISGSLWNDMIRVDGFSPKSDEDATVDFNVVSDGYFVTLGTPMLAGRDFTDGDQSGSAKVAIVNSALARKFFRGANPLGKRFRIQGGTGDGPPLEIVGLVGDAKYQSLREEAPPTAYVPISQQEEPGPFMNFELRAAASPAALIPGVTSAFGAVNPDISLEFVTLSDQVAQSLTRERLLAMLSTFFGALALALAMIGLYGIMSYNVARRRNEIGIRIALGAARARVLRMVLGEVGRMVIAGVVLGIGAALAVTRLVSSLLFGVTPSDPVTLLLSALLLVVVALAAGALPAWRAARLDPMEALREE